MNSLQLLEFTVSILLAVCEVHAESRLNDTNLGPKTPFPKVWNRHETNNSYLSSMENMNESTLMTDTTSKNSRNTRRNRGDRIINGYTVALKNHPWVVSIKMRRTNGKNALCGGTIIADDTILTAAHCVKHACEGTVYSSDIRKFEGSRYNFECLSDQVVIRPKYDMALIKVKQKIDGVPLALPTGPEEAPTGGDKIFVLGWGRVCNVWGKPCAKQDYTSKILQGVTVKVASECAKEGSLCAGGYDEHGFPGSACKGDSGTTVECKDKKGSVYLCGLVASGPGPPNCGKGKGKFTAVADKKALEWIKTYTTIQTTPRKKHVWETSNQSRPSDRRALVSDPITILIFVLLDTVF